MGLPRAILMIPHPSQRVLVSMANSCIEANAKIKTIGIYPDGDFLVSGKSPGGAHFGAPFHIRLKENQLGTEIVAYAGSLDAKFLRKILEFLSYRLNYNPTHLLLDNVLECVMCKKNLRDVRRRSPKKEWRITGLLCEGCFENSESLSVKELHFKEESGRIRFLEEIPSPNANQDIKLENSECSLCGQVFQYTGHAPKPHWKVRGMLCDECNTELEGEDKEKYCANCHRELGFFGKHLPKEGWRMNCWLCSECDRKMGEQEKRGKEEKPTLPKSEPNAISSRSQTSFDVILSTEAAGYYGGHKKYLAVRAFSDFQSGSLTLTGKHLIFVKKDKHPENRWKIVIPLSSVIMESGR